MGRRVSTFRQSPRPPVGLTAGVTRGDPRRHLSRKAWLVVAAALVAVAAAVGLAVAFTSGSSSHRRQAIVFTHDDYVRAFMNATVGKMRVGEISSWPKPYQTFTDQYRHQCYEWWDKGHALLNLCFKKGLLALKATE